MDIREFEGLQVGDKVCIVFRPDYWGYVEDIDRTAGTIEFDLEEAVGNAPIQTEIKISYNYVKVLEKAKPQTEIPAQVKVVIQNTRIYLDEALAELALLKEWDI